MPRCRAELGVILVLFVLDRPVLASIWRHYLLSDFPVSMIDLTLGNHFHLRPSLTTINPDVGSVPAASILHRANPAFNFWKVIQ